MPSLDMQLPRGIRNGNPLNLKFNPNIVWKHQCGIDDDDFLIFKPPLWGIRAGCMNVRHIDEVLNHPWLSFLIGRWVGNDKSQAIPYAKYIAEQLHVPTDKPLDLHAMGFDLCCAMITFENGYNPYDDNLIIQAIHLSHIQ